MEYTTIKRGCFFVFFPTLYLFRYEYFPICMQQVLKLLTNQEAETVSKVNKKKKKKK